MLLKKLDNLWNNCLILFNRKSIWSAKRS